MHPDTSGAETHNGQSYKRIETIVAGDRVLAWSETTGALSWRAVTHTFVHQTTLLFDVQYSDGTKVQTTWNHPFWIDGRGWVEAKDLAGGDVSATAAQLHEAHVQNGGRALSEAHGLRGPPSGSAITSSREHPLSAPVSVYNFEVDTDHTYFVTQNQVLVHNYLQIIVGGLVVVGALLIPDCSLGEKGGGCGTKDQLTNAGAAIVGGAILGPVAGRFLGKLLGRTAGKAGGEVAEEVVDVVAKRNAHLAGKVHPKTGVPFDAKGFPDFRAAGVVKEQVKIAPTGSRAGDFRAANEAAGLRRTPEGYSWHHHQDGKTMQLVPRDIHARTGHTGPSPGK